jgi:hypothetical protein
MPLRLAGQALVRKITGNQRVINQGAFLVHFDAFWRTSSQAVIPQSKARKPL